jgi:site-specific recombinase XerD
MLRTRARSPRGRARATIARRLCTIVGFYRYAEEEGLIARHATYIAATFVAGASR